MTVNVERLRKEIEFIASNPDKWHQNYWAQKTACGTAACLAGNTVLNEGIELSWQGGFACWTESGIAISQEAARILGLTWTQADRLFHENNSLEDIYDIANEITNGEIEIPVEYQD